MFNQSLSMRVIITIDDVSHIAVRDNVKTTCDICSLSRVCAASSAGLCDFFGLNWKHHFELLIPETKSKEDDKE